MNFLNKFQKYWTGDAFMFMQLVWRFFRKVTYVHVQMIEYSVEVCVERLPVSFGQALGRFDIDYSTVKCPDMFIHPIKYHSEDFFYIQEEFPSFRLHFASVEYLK